MTRLRHPALEWLLPLLVPALLAWPAWRFLQPRWAALARPPGAG